MDIDKTKISKHNIVFVKNKLMSTDAILPILIELKRNYNCSSEIIVFDDVAHRAINENIVIKDAIKYIGGEIFITKGIKNKIYRRIYLIKGLFLIIIKAIFGANLFHFGALNRYPLKIIGIIFRKNVYMFFGGAHNFQYPKYSKFYGNNPKYFKNIGDNCVLFNDNYDAYKDFKNVSNFVSPKNKKVWIDYIREKSYFYLNKFHSNINLENGCFVVVSGPPLPDSSSPKLQNLLDDAIRLFKETIDVLMLYSETIPIMIKPHPLSDMELIRNFVNDKSNIFITYLHPTLLCMNARVFIANQFSGIMADAHEFGIDTIEYTNYNDNLLNATNGESVDKEFVTHFINNDYNLFKGVISDIASRTYHAPTYSGISSDDSKLLKKIAYGD
jgi:hypothetical protein